MSLSKRMYEAQVEETPLARLGRARQCVQNALREAADVLTLCDIEHALNDALREMDRLQLTLAVMERQQERMAS